MPSAGPSKHAESMTSSSTPTGTSQTAQTPGSIPSVNASKFAEWGPGQGPAKPMVSPPMWSEPFSTPLDTLSGGPSVGPSPPFSISKEQVFNAGPATDRPFAHTEEPALEGHNPFLPNGPITQTLQGMDTEQWFDIQNFTFDMEQLAALAGIAQNNGAMFDPSDIGVRL
jgi:hypothetical protein